MKKKIFVIVSVLFALAVAAGILVWYWMGEPMYRPGNLATGEGLRAPLEPPEQPGEADFWAVEPDIRLYHQTAGTGRKVLVVHGGPGFPFAGPLPGLEPLTDQYQFFYYHQRGCGQSTRPIDRFSSTNFYENAITLNETLGIGAQVADMERIRRILDEEKLVLIGHSYGAFLAAMYAAEFPDRVEALVLVAPADLLVMPIEGGGLFEEVRKHLPEGMLADYDEFMTEYFDFGRVFEKTEAELAALNGRFVPFYEAAAEARGFTIPHGVGTEDGGGWMVQAQYFGMGRRHDYRGALEAVRAPVLVIHGEKDLQTEQASRAFAAIFVDSSFQIIEDAGHFPFIEQPESFSAVTADFLKAF